MILGAVLGLLRAILGLKRDKKSQVDTRRTSRASKYRKTAFSKSISFLCENHTFRVLEAPKTILRRAYEVQRSSQKALEELQDLKKGIQKDPPKYDFWGSVLGSISASKWLPKLIKIGTKRGTKLMLAFR